MSKNNRHKICIQEEKISFVDIILNYVYNLWIMILFLVCNLVLQNGDTLIFMKNGEVVEKQTIGVQNIGDNQKVSSLAKVSPDNRFYLVHKTRQKIVVAKEVEHEIETDTITSTEILFLNANKDILYADQANGTRFISYELSDIYDSLFVLTTWDQHHNNPSFSVVKDGEKAEIIKEGDWQRIVSYKISPNNRFVLFHTRNPYHGKSWDYIFFYDLNTGRTWDYMFPTCLSCKKGRIELEIDDNGRSEVIHKREHRVFSRDGLIQDIYLQLQ